jgi:deoxyribonuclease V
MKLAVDVDYRHNEAHIAGVSFADWQDTEPECIYSSSLSNIAEYIPGEFFKRELPCILTLLHEHKLEPECIVVDGFVYLDGHKKPGLGKHLYDALHGNTTVIGVAKQPFKDLPEYCAIFRGESSKPLYVTSEGIDIDTAKDHIRSMHGDFRIPKLLKMADQLCKSTERKP